MATHTFHRVCIAASCFAAAAPVLGWDTIDVAVTGEVEFNQIRNSPIDRTHVTAGSPAVLTFQLDSTNFLDSVLFPVRGYAINPSSFSLVLNDIPVGLQNPYPPGLTPYFVVRNNDPGVDGFFLSSHIDTGAPEGVPTDEPGIFGQFFNNFYVTYGGSTLPSLDIHDAIGTYDFTGLSVFNWTMDDGEFGPNAMGLLFAQMTITPEPSSILLLGVFFGVIARRR